MLQLRKILFPMDYSDSCSGAAAYVAAFGGRFQSEIALLHAVAGGAGIAAVAGLEGALAVDFSQEETNRAQQIMSTYRFDDFKHLDVSRIVVQGDPAEQIVETAKQSGTDLIMMPSHGLGMFRRLILGSVTAKVLHDATCPVWTGVHLENAPRLDAIRFRKVLCAVDLGPQSEKALLWADAFSKEFSTELIAVHAVPEVRPYQYFDLPPVNRLEESGRAQLQDLVRKLGITARVVVKSGEPAPAVCEVARTENADQMVIARGATTGGFGRLRTHAYALIRSAPCPVVSI